MGPGLLEASRSTVSFHNFKSQNLKLSVSNPKNKYVAYVSVLSQMPNCQGLGRKNKHEVLKTDRKEMPRDTVIFDVASKQIRIRSIVHELMVK